MDTNDDGNILFAEYDTYMVLHTYELCEENDPNVVVAVYMKDGYVQHSSRKINSVYWESKMGQSIRMSHLPNALDDSGADATYGTRQYWYRYSFP